MLHISRPQVPRDKKGNLLKWQKEIYEEFLIKTACQCLSFCSSFVMMIEVDFFPLLKWRTRISLGWGFGLDWEHGIGYSGNKHVGVFSGLENELQLRWSYKPPKPPTNNHGQVFKDWGVRRFQTLKKCSKMLWGIQDLGLRCNKLQ